MHSRCLLAVAALGLIALPVATPLPAQASVTVTPDVPRLPVGAMPAMPYVDWPARRIVDGSRRISIRGIQARVTELHKVDGGYLLRRRLDEQTRSEDVVFVATSGARRSVATVHWQRPITVSSDGSKVVLTRTRLENGRIAYADTAVLALPSGRRLHVEDFGTFAPGVHFYGSDRVLLTVTNEAQGLRPDVTWWTPATGELLAVRENAAVESADRSAWQYAVRPLDGATGYRVEPLPPDTGAGWPVAQEDHNLGSWSTDDALIWGNNEQTDQPEGFYGSTSYLVHRAVDGQLVLSVRNGAAPWATWESDDVLLLRAGYGTGMARRHQLIRCRLSGACSRIGSPSDSEWLAIIPATRRR